MKKSKRSNVDPFIVMDVMEAARIAESSGKKIIHMEVGQPGTAAPKYATNTLVEAMENNNLGYTVALGLPELRKRISQLYGEWYNVDINPNRIAITPGSSSAFVASFTSLFDSGDRVGIAAPGYPSYKQILKALDLEPVTIETSIHNRFQPMPEDLSNNDLAGFLIASPANPTGSMLDYGSLTDLIHISQENNISFISDEIYHGIEYENKAVTALEITNDCYVINSFSKYFSMTGWRIGYTAGTGIATVSPPPLITGIGTYQFNEQVTGSISGAIGRVKSWDKDAGTLKLGTTDGTFIPGDIAVGDVSGAEYSVDYIEAAEFEDKYDQNTEIETEADAIVDFSESNPFGQV